MSLEPRDLVTDAERDQAIAALRHYTAAGVLSLDDFAEGVEAILVAQNRTELVAITGRLPAISEPSAPPTRVPATLGGRCALRRACARSLATR